MDADSLVEQVAALKHDLGKYVAWMSANLEESAWTGPVEPLLVSALQSDILATKKGSDGDRAAWEVWAQHAAAMPRPFDPPELSDVDDAVGVLRSAEAVLRAGDDEGIGQRRAAIRDAQRTIRSALASAYRTARARAEEA
ncbi:MAG: hypothetical protein AAF721_31150 [Myxococcota bacterium]